MTGGSLRLFGGFELRLTNGQELDLPGQKDRGLLAYLALSAGATHSRERLASLLWSDRGDPQARDSLKHALTRLRQCLGEITPSPIQADRQSVRLDASGLSIDVANFENLIRDNTPQSTDKAAALYVGQLLDGHGVRDAGFEEWLLIERERLRRQVEAALTALLSPSTEAAIRERAAMRLLALDPLREAACRALMTIYADRGETAQALRMFETLRDRLHAELGVRPEAETVKLHDAIRQGRLEPKPPPSAEAAKTSEAESLPLPGRPSIAVLPFQNLSEDPNQEYFADGMVEEIITALSRLSWLFVIARNSSFAYRGRVVDVKQIGRELGVRYILEGSVRRSANRVRISGQLVDTTTGAHLWADRFDGGLEDVFDLQDQVASSVVSAIAPKMEQAEIERARRKPTESLDAYDHYLRGLACVYKWTEQDSEQALRHFYRAIELDPNFAAAYGMAARCYSQRKVGGWIKDRAKERAETARLAQWVTQFGKDDPVATSTAGMGLAYVLGELDDGDALIERGLTLNPNWAWAWLFGGWVKIWMGSPELALERFAQAKRLCPHDPQYFNMQAGAAAAHFFAGRYAEASTLAEAALRQQPSHFIAAGIAAASAAHRGDLELARRAVKHLQEIDPDLSQASLREHFPIRNQVDFDRWVDGLRLAGMWDKE